MTPAEREDALVEELGVIDDPRERLVWLIDRGSRVGDIPPERRDPARRVLGCISAVWVEGELHDGRLHWSTAADSPMVAALVALLVELYEGATPAEVLRHEPAVIQRLQFDRILSPTRLNGLAAVRQRLRDLAMGLPA